MVSIQWLNGLIARNAVTLALFRLDSSRSQEAAGDVRPDPTVHHSFDISACRNSENRRRKVDGQALGDQTNTNKTPQRYTW